MIGKHPHAEIIDQAIAAAAGVEGARLEDVSPDLDSETWRANSATTAHVIGALYDRVVGHGEGMVVVTDRFMAVPVIAGGPFQQMPAGSAGVCLILTGLAQDGSPATVFVVIPSHAAGELGATAVEAADAIRRNGTPPGGESHEQ